MTGLYFTFSLKLSILTHHYSHFIAEKPHKGLFAEHNSSLLIMLCLQLKYIELLH